jgi:hypothetical protein
MGYAKKSPPTSSSCCLTDSPTFVKATPSTPRKTAIRKAPLVAQGPAGQEDITVESAEECPGECIFIES